MGSGNSSLNRNANQNWEPRLVQHRQIARDFGDHHLGDTEFMIRVRRQHPDVELLSKQLQDGYEALHINQSFSPIVLVQI